MHKPLNKSRLKITMNQSSFKTDTKSIRLIIKENNIEKLVVIHFYIMYFLFFS